MAKGKLTYQGKMQFLAESASGHKITLDAAGSVGGENRGPRPMELLLLSLAGCTAMDVVSILNKMRVPFDTFEIDVDGDRADDHPKVYTAVRLVYRLTGPEVNAEKVARAVELSQERYCSVSHMVKKTATLTYAIEINGTVTKTLTEGPAV